MSRAFNLEDEKDAVRDAYGRNLFGQGCLLARRLVERGVPFVEVTLGGQFNTAMNWDTHNNNFEMVKQLSGVLDPAWATLMSDLKDRGLLDSTLIVWMGEFGRTPKISNGNGRDHYPNAWSTVLAGGGIKGGQAIGKTSTDGTTIEERAVSVPDLMATICKILGLDPLKQNQSNVGRPIRLAEKTATPIVELLPPPEASYKTDRLAASGQEPVCTQTPVQYRKAGLCNPPILHRGRSTDPGHDPENTELMVIQTATKAAPRPPPPDEANARVHYTPDWSPTPRGVRTIYCSRRR